MLYEYSLYSLTSSDFIIILLEKDVPKDTFNYEAHKTFLKVFFRMCVVAAMRPFLNRPNTDDIKGAINVQGHKIRLI